MENCPLISRSLLEQLDTKDYDPVNQFGHLYRQESLGTQAGIQSGKEGERANQATRMGEQETRRDQMAADANQQLIWSQLSGSGAN